jgi:hypothetical protein
VRALFLFSLLPGCIFVFDDPDPETDTETFAIEGSFTRVIVDSDAGSVSIAPGGGPVTAELRWTDERPEVTADVSSGTLTVGVQCAPRQEQCSADLDIPVPDGVAVEIGTGAGDVWLEEVSGPTAFVSTGAGGVIFSDVEILDIEASTGAGDVDITDLVVPDAIRADTGTNDVVLRVPAGPYRIEASTGVGEITVDPAIVDDPESPRLLHASTGAGDVRIGLPAGAD